MSLDRRQFMSATALTGFSLMTSSVTGARDIQAAAVNAAAGDSKKEWAQRALRGGESFVMTSMQPDLQTLDEEGIRRDVRHAIHQGFCSILPLPLAIDSKTERQFYEIVADEARGKILTVGVIRPGKWEDLAAQVRQMERLGFSHALMYFNSALPSQEAMYQQMRTVVENTSLGIVLYASPKREVARFDPTGLPMDAFDRLADLDNVVGIKFTQELRPATALTVAQRLGDRLLLAVVDLEVMLLLALKYPMQWTGQWAIDSVQSPDQPWVREFLDLLSKGDLNVARELYWRYEPITTGFYDLQRPSLSIGGHPWMHIKYMKWLTGGNGGLLPDQKTSPEMVPHLDADGRRLCRDLFAKVGIKTVDLPDEAFIVGNAAYERGVRVKDLKSLPQYVL
jgi:4-hydroxy-tetrahydrodipicolinate synthase